MDWTTVKGHWTAFTPRIMTRWPDLDEDEVQAAAGERDAFAAHLAEVQGLDRDEAEAEIDDFLMGSEPIDAVMDPTRDNELIGKPGAHIPEGEDVYAEDRDFGDDNLPDPPAGRTE